VRDLWGLRVSLVHKREHGSGYGSGTGTTTMFSSMSEGESTDTDGTKAKSLASGRSRKSAVKEERLPRLVETLALCYLALILLRLPTSLGEVYKWATREEVVYSRAVSSIAIYICFIITNVAPDLGSAQGDETQTPRPFSCCS
jgi:RNA polymerase I-specific transcription initiation factor RRN7